MPKLTQRMPAIWDVGSSKGPRLFPRVDKNEIAKYIDDIQKSSCPGPLGQLQPNLAQKFSSVKSLRIQGFYSNEGS